MNKRNYSRVSIRTNGDASSQTQAKFSNNYYANNFFNDLNALKKFKDNHFASTFTFEQKYQRLVLKDLVDDVVKRNPDLGKTQGLFMRMQQRYTEVKDYDKVFRIKRPKSSFNMKRLNLESAYNSQRSRENPNLSPKQNNNTVQSRTITPLFLDRKVQKLDDPSVWDYYVHVGPTLEENFCKDYEKKMEKTQAAKKIEAKRQRNTISQLSIINKMNKRLNKLGHEYQTELKVQSPSLIKLNPNQSSASTLHINNQKGFVREIKVVKSRKILLMPSEMQTPHQD